MATIVTRAGKGSALTFQEADDNFVNLNADGTANSASIANLQNDKLDKSGGTLTGALTVNANLIAGGKVLGSTSNNSQSGTSVTVSAPSTEIVRLTNVLLTSISGITAGSSGQKLVLVNRTGTTITIENESPSATSSQDQVYTGSGGSLLLNDKASISLVYDSTTSRWNVIGGTGSGSGSSGINYILNPDASVGLTGYSVYNDSAAVPVDGSGGTPPAGLFVRSTTSPLRGSGDFNIVKTGSTSYQGAGVAYDFTIDNADLAKVLTVTFDYEVVSGTYVTGDFTVYLIQDPAGTPVVIQPAGYQIQSATVGTKMKQIATFQTASNVNSYRLCFHCATTSALDYTLALDSISVGPQVVQYGAPVTDFVSYTTTVTHNSGTATNYNTDFKWRRVGDSLQVIGKLTFTGSAGTWSGLLFSLPPGLSIDTSKLNISSSDIPLGLVTYLDAAVAAFSGVIVQAGTQVVVAKVSAAGGTYSEISGQPTQSVPFAWASGDAVMLNFEVPVLGWSSTVQMSNDTDTRVVAMRANGNPASATAGNPIIVPTVGADTHGAYNATTGIYTAPVSGWYVFAGFVQSVATGVTIRLYVDSAFVFDIGQTDSNGEGIFYALYSLNAGQQAWIGTGTTFDASAVNYSIYRLSGPSAIAASESVVEIRGNTAGTTINTTTTVIPYATQIKSSHGGWDAVNNRWVAPISGTYNVSFLYQNIGAGVDRPSEIFIRKNLSAFAHSANRSPTAATATGSYSDRYSYFINTLIELNAGDYIDFCAISPAAASSLNNTLGFNRISINRVGN